MTSQLKRTPPVPYVVSDETTAQTFLNALKTRRVTSYVSKTGKNRGIFLILYRKVSTQLRISMTVVLMPGLDMLLYTAVNEAVQTRIGECMGDPMPLSGRGPTGIT